jgi:hypothetical protein
VIGRFWVEKPEATDPIAMDGRKMHHREGFAASGGLKEYANKL